MPKVSLVTVTLQNKPGTLAQVCSALGKAGVNISALLAPEIRGKGKVRLLVDNLDKAKDALRCPQCEARIEVGDEITWWNPDRETTRWVHVRCPRRRR